MTKIQYALASLIASVPALILGGLLILAMLSYSENLSMMAYAVMGITLLSAGTVVLMPVAILVGGRPKPTPPKPVVTPKKGSSADDSIDGDVEMMEGSSDSIEADALDASEEFDLGDSSDSMGADLSEDAMTTENLDDFDDDFEIGGDDDFEIEEEEEVKPKSKKKKR